MDETPDELAVRFEGLAWKVARRNLYRIPKEAAGLDDLKQVCWVAILQAARAPAGRLPWEQFATLCARRAANDFIQRERRRGMRLRSGPKGKGEQESPPRVGNLGDGDEWVEDGPRRRREAPLPVTSGDRVDPDAAEELLETFRQIPPDVWTDPRTPEVVEQLVRGGLSQAALARRLGVSREWVGAIVRPLRKYLRGEGA